MSNGTNVLILEDDLYACDFMAMLLIRDWRTRVVASIGSVAELSEMLNRPDKKVDLVLIDTEVPEHSDWLLTAVDLIKSSKQPTCAILCTGTKPHRQTLDQVIRLNCGGYVMKGEIGYGLAAAARQAARGRWVITAGVERLALEQQISLPSHRVVLKSRVDLGPLTPREKEFAKLSILFQLSQRDLEDELIITKNHVAKCIQIFYDKIALRNILEADYPLEELFESERVKQLFREAQQRNGLKKRVRNLATLAFHLLTVVDKQFSD